MKTSVYFATSFTGNIYAIDFVMYGEREGERERRIMINFGY